MTRNWGIVAGNFLRLIARIGERRLVGRDTCVLSDQVGEIEVGGNNPNPDTTGWEHPDSAPADWRSPSESESPQKPASRNSGRPGCRHPGFPTCSNPHGRYPTRRDCRRQRCGCRCWVATSCGKGCANPVPRPATAPRAGAPGHKMDCSGRHYPLPDQGGVFCRSGCQPVGPGRPQSVAFRLDDAVGQGLQIVRFRRAAGICGIITGAIAARRPAMFRPRQTKACPHRGRCT